MAAYVLAGLLLLAGCTPIDVDRGGKGRLTLRFRVDGIAERIEETQARSISGEPVQSFFTKTADGLMMTSTLEADSNSKTRTRSVSVMGNGVKYRVVAYNGGTYIKHADGVAGVEEAVLDLDFGYTSYNVVAYSYNTSDALPTHSESLNLGNSDDFLWVNVGSVSVTAGEYTDISLTFKHQSCAIIIQADGTDIVHNAHYASLYGPGEKVRAIASVIKNVYSVVSFSPSNGNITTGGSTANISQNWPTLGEKIITSKEAYFYPISSTPISLTFNSIRFDRDETASGTDYNGTTSYTGVPVSFEAALTKGKRYTLKVKFHKKCGVMVKASSSADTWYEFQCYNLGANETISPFIPDARLHGAKYRFGTSSPALSMAADQSNAGTVAGWSSLPYDATYGGAWLSNPCPSGWRMPTINEWMNLIYASNGATDENIVRTFPGTWTNDAANYSSGIMFGKNLFLPAAGSRDADTGALNNRGSYGYYWTDKMSSTWGGGGWGGSFTEDNPYGFYGNARGSGYSIRCISAK